MLTLQRHLATLATALSCYESVHQEIADGFPEQINPEEEDEALQQQSDTVEEAEMLSQLLVSITSATQELFAIHNEVHEVERLMGHPVNLICTL